MELFRLFGRVFVDNDKANEALDTTDKKGKGVMGTLTSMAGTAVKWGAAGAAAGAAAVGGLVAFVNKTSAAADEIDKLSERTGINREELQRWKYAAGQSGADIGKLENGIKTLSASMVNATNGNEAATAAFEKLGISVIDLKNKSQSEVFDQVIKSLAGMEQGAARNALGNQVLGKSYTELLPLLNQGTDGIDALKNRADELGLVMSEDAVKANVKFGDTFADVKQTVGAMAAQIGTGMIPVLMVFLNLILDNMPPIQRVFSTVFGVLGTLVTGFIEGIKFLIEYLQVWFANNQETVNGIKTAFQEFFGTVIELVQGFITGFKRFWNAYGEDIKRIIGIILDTVVGTFKGAFNMIQGILKIFTGIFTGDWNKVWEGVKQTFRGAWDGMVSIAKGAANLIINALNSMINGLNKIKFEVPSWVPLIGGKGWGFNLSQIPLLAAGGDVRRGGAAIVGEAGPELLELPTGARVTPLSKLPQQPTTINNISFADMMRGAVFHVREEADIDKIAQKLYEKQQTKLRPLGVE